MFVRVQVPPRVLKEIVIDYLIVCYGFFIILKFMNYIIHNTNAREDN